MYLSCSFDNGEKMQGYTNEFYNQLSGHRILENILENHMSESSTGSGWESHLYQDMRFYLQDDMLVKVDRSSMAHSLEVRVPYLDHHIVEFMALVPANMKYRLFTSKYLLKSLVKKYRTNARSYTSDISNLQSLTVHQYYHYL